VTFDDGERRFIPAGTNIVWSLCDLHRDKRHWGADADDWRPHRWLQGAPGTVTSPAPPGAWQPFHGGARMYVSFRIGWNEHGDRRGHSCMGIEFANNQALYVIARLLQRFDRIDMDPAQPRPQYVARFTLHWPGGIHLRFREAGKA
jgi:cytochrome P450